MNFRLERTPMQFRTCRIEFWRSRRAAERGTLVIFTVARNRAVEFSISRLDGATTDGKKFRANRSVPSRRRTGGFGFVAVESCGGWSRIRSCKYRGCRLTSRARRLCSQTSAVVSEENDSLPPSPKRLNLCVELD